MLAIANTRFLNYDLLTIYFSRYTPTQLIPALVIGTPAPPEARVNLSHPLSFLLRPVEYPSVGNGSTSAFSCKYFDTAFKFAVRVDFCHSGRLRQRPSAALFAERPATKRLPGALNAFDCTNGSVNSDPVPSNKVVG